MVAINLSELGDQIRQQYSNVTSYVVPTTDLALTENGKLSTGKNEYLLTAEGRQNLAQKSCSPVDFFCRLDTDVQAVLFNRLFKQQIDKCKLPIDLRIYLNQHNQFVGLDKPGLLRIRPIKLIELLENSLPKNFPPEKVGIGQANLLPTRIQISCFSPQITTEPREGDILNGGVDILHHTCGDVGTQVHCYLRRLVCENGSIAHLCGENRQLRARRLNNGRFDEDDMYEQISRLLQEAWTQVGEKLEAVKRLTEKERVSPEFLQQQRTRFSLNEGIISAIELAIRDDELGETGTQFDLFNAISRVATHRETLTFRQRRMLSRMAGEVSQQDAHRCESCGNWIIREN